MDSTRRGSPPAQIELLSGAHERRRLILEFLARRGAPVELADLVEHLRHRLEGGPHPMVSPPDETHLHILLHHVDLPKLERLGLLTYDATSREITVVER